MLIDKKLMRPRAVHFNDQPSHVKKITILNMRTKIHFTEMRINIAKVRLVKSIGGLHRAIFIF